MLNADSDTTITKRGRTGTVRPLLLLYFLVRMSGFGGAEGI